MKDFDRVRKDDLLLAAIAEYLLADSGWKTVDDVYSHLAEHRMLRGLKGLPNSLCTLNMIPEISNRKAALGKVMADMTAVRAVNRRSAPLSWRAYSVPSRARPITETAPWDIDAELAAFSAKHDNQIAVCSIHRCHFDWTLAVKEEVHFPLERIAISFYTYVWSVGVGVPGMPLRFHYGHTVRAAFDRAKAFHAKGFVPPL